MAIDEVIATSVRQGFSPPTFRIYGWRQHAVSLGSFQSSGDLDVAYCRGNAIPIVRRPTGGRAVFHDDELTYSFSAGTKAGVFSHGLFDSYRKISSALALGLSRAGLSPQHEMRKKAPASRYRGANASDPRCFASVSYREISIGSVKVIGSAQKRWADALLQQGSIPFTVDEERVMNIFPRTTVYEQQLTKIGLSHIEPSLSYEGLKSALWVAFEETFQIRLIRSDLSHEEMTRAQEIAVRKYLTDDWTFRR